VRDTEVPVEARTRDRVTALLHELGASSAAVLAERLALTPAVVRRHLDAMLPDGTVEARDERPRGRRGRGRPAKVFTLTEAGRAAMPHAYDDIAGEALRYLAETGGEAAVTAFARRRIAGAEHRYATTLARTRPARRPEALADALSRDGYAASTEAAGVGVQLCQHHCPVQHVAEEFPQLCDAETEAIGRLLGTHVQRLATIAHGDGVCTTHVPLTHQHVRAGPTASTAQGRTAS
jgi:predicted ArsR family transcriptional regulator